jgi:L-amino acid N-acyltransferase YncA
VTTIRPVREQDAPAIAAIYAPFVRDTAITFESEVPDAAEIGTRIRALNGIYPWFVAVDGEDRPNGYAYATAFRTRHAYRFTVETTVYVDPAAQGRGVGRMLYDRLIGTLTRQGFAQAIGVIAGQNAASVRLHEAAGFALNGVYRNVGYKLGQWHDVGLWQRALADVGTEPQEPVRFVDLAG